jgi:hypothetical protein
MATKLNHSPYIEKECRNITAIFCLREATKLGYGPYRKRVGKDNYRTDELSKFLYDFVFFSDLGSPTSSRSGTGRYVASRLDFLCKDRF